MSGDARLGGAPAGGDPPTGNADRRPIATVFVPGLLCDARLWSRVEALVDGEASHVDLDDATSLEAMADRILDAPHHRFVLAGFSMGGMAALLAAAREPSRIAGLATLSTHAERDTPERVRARRDQIAEVDANGLEAFVAERLLPAYFETPAARPDACALVKAMAEAKAPGVFRTHVEALIARPDMAAASAVISAPSHVLTGENDTIAPPDLARRLAATIPGARVRILAGCGHLAPLERPREIAAILTDLAAHAAPPPPGPARAEPGS